MKSKAKITLIVVGTILVSLVLIFAIYKEKNPKEKNIFDEMYYGEKKIDRRGDNTPFSKIKGIESWNRKRREDTWQNGDIVLEKYENKYTSKKIGEWNIMFSFNFEKKGIGINFSNEVSIERINIIVYYRYDVDKKIILEKISLHDKNLPRENARIEEIAKIKEYLEKNNISIKDLKETADELLYEKVIGDWEKYTNSRYSKDNLGTVKIERSPLFDGVD